MKRDHLAEALRSLDRAADHELGDHSTYDQLDAIGRALIDIAASLRESNERARILTGIEVER